MKTIEELTALFKQRIDERTERYRKERQELDDKFNADMETWQAFSNHTPQIIAALKAMHLGISQWNYCGNLSVEPLSDKFRFSIAREANYDALSARAEKMAAKIAEATGNMVRAEINPFSLHLSGDQQAKSIIMDLRLPVNNSANNS